MKKYSIDKDHSVAVFAVRHMMIAHVRGMFHRISGVISYDPGRLSNSSVQAEIDVKSLHTGVKKRDEHLLSDEILDADRHPTMTFVSKSVAPAGVGRGTVAGGLTIHGITKDVVFEVEHFGPVKNLFGGEITVGFTARTTINREDFGILWGSDPLEGGGLMTSTSVEIILDVEADLVQE